MTSEIGCHPGTLLGYACRQFLRSPGSPFPVQVPGSGTEILSPDDCKSQAAKFNKTFVKKMEDNDQFWVDRQLPAETKHVLNYFGVGRSIAMTTNYLYLIQKESSAAKWFRKLMRTIVGTGLC